MKAIALTKARDRLGRAMDAVEKVRESRDYDTFSRHWTDFLIAVSAIDNILEAGAKQAPKSKQWCGEKKHVRSKDPMLSYLKQARNVEEHGLEPVTKYQPELLAIGGPSESFILNGTIGGPPGTGLRITPEPGSSVTVSRLPATAALVTVVDERFGTRFDPPTHHLGQSLTDISPPEIASLAIAYYESLLDESSSLVQ